MEVLIDIAKHSHGIIFKILPWVHEHRVKYEPVQHNEHRDKYPQHQRNRIPNVRVKVVLVHVRRVVSLENRQELHKGAKRGIRLGEDGDSVEQTQRVTPVRPVLLQGLNVVIQHAQFL